MAVADEADAIAGFWAWFAAHADRLASAAGATMATELQRHLDLIAPLDWELGPDEGVGAGGDDRSFFALRTPTGAIDVVLRPPAEPPLAADDALAVAHVLVDGELGESVRFEVVGAIDVVGAWDDRAARAARRLEVGLLARLVGGARH